MQIINSEDVFSASDLVHFLECQHLTYLDLKVLRHEIRKEFETPALMKILQEKGLKHERKHLEVLKVPSQIIIEIPKGNLTLAQRAKLTEDAIKSGADVIYQAVLYRHPWQGEADFLVRINTPSPLGSFSYEVLDTKLSKTSYPKYLIQLCIYSDLVKAIQGVAPKMMHLVLGNNENVSFKFNEFCHYIDYAKLRFEEFVSRPPLDSYPQPVSYCKFCDWKDRCKVQWQNDNYLSLIANIRRSQIDKFLKANIKTVDVVAQLPDTTLIPELNPEVFNRLHSQAVLQEYKLQSGKDKYEILACKSGEGFERLPKPDAGDLFFDMEGNPLHENGLEYLFGIYYQHNGQAEFKAIWGHDHVQEREAFAKLMQFFGDHLAEFPDAYIYHYAQYEPSALKRLACRYSLAEEQLDNLLRQNKFVDLYKVVRETVRTSEPSYSIKNLETFYMGKRKAEVSTATDSIVVYNQWCETQDQYLLAEIEKYNKEDCISTQKLRDWLVSLRPSATPWFVKEKKLEDDFVARKPWEIEYDDYTQRLLTGASEVDYQIRELMSQLLEFHRREAKPEWWARFERQDKFGFELIDDTECLAGLTSVGEPVPNKRSLTYTYQFPPQEYKICKGNTVTNVETMDRVGTIEEIDDDNCIVKIRRGKTLQPLPSELSIGPANPINTDSLRAAIYRVATNFINGSDQYQAISAILNKSIPAIKNIKAGEAIIQSKDLFTDALNAVVNLDKSYLFIQGPPGAGKTYTSSHMIVKLLHGGFKIGVTANSHKVIHHLLDEIEEVAIKQDVKISGVYKYSDKDSLYKGKFISNEGSITNIDLNLSLFAGTAWLFADEKFDQQLDYLFIEEAGQISLANLVATGTAAKNIVLIGDQMQLAQPIKGIHPGDSGKSVLEFLLGNMATIPPNRGIFLPDTRRLNKEICGFISQAFYDGRLNPHPDNCKRLLQFQNPIDGISSAGIQIVFTNHVGCSQKSVEEGEIIKKYYEELIKQNYSTGEVRTITHNDILVVTPYNVQVNYLKSILPKEARVGTVDKFQGQEAPIVLISMVTSSAEDLPRNLEFLYSKNRLNVALSRAQCLAIMVMNRKLLEAPCRTIEQMSLVNTFCMLRDYVASE